MRLFSSRYRNFGRLAGLRLGAIKACGQRRIAAAADKRAAGWVAAVALMLVNGTPQWAISGPVSGAVQLRVPVGCDLGRTCFIQQYFDHDSGPGRQDYRCGTLLGDGHDGIDFRVRRGLTEVPVLAAADGIVLRTRDAMPDRSVRSPAGAVAPDRMAGNGVILRHDDVMETQYSHLKLGSIAVVPGQRVKAGQRLGLVGMSGNTEYLHLHLNVRIGGVKVDPFTGSAGPVACAAPSPRSLWSAEAQRQLAYQPSGVADGGFSGERPGAADARGGSLPELGSSPPALILWSDSFGVVEGDEEHFTIRDPSGLVLLARRQPVARRSLVWFSFAGVPRPGKGWAKGIYVGEYSLFRNGRKIGGISATAMLGAP